jgi:hypothetical protein
MSQNKIKAITQKRFSTGNWGRDSVISLMPQEKIKRL